ncbi:Nif11-like leader peptide family natural product precursor [Simkania negevensis]|uniref:Uncharacterized protein n=1 Tax=Simkania negevensis (strain ATCC VR-1471 / DSM 27360 / Z) TaxID=331113 RepID=F8L2Q6_SIMNZ|nr:Nif11-like leader peptide family natural product precursor [Simkania negevensis]CCB87752.1 unknown protein [Simkania negevensis Z]
MHVPFYNKVKKLQAKLRDCKSREEVTQLARAFDVDLLIEYTTNSFCSFTENLRNGLGSGSLSLSVKVKISDGNIAAIGRLAAGFYIYGNDVSKEDIEREHVKSIIHALQCVHFEVGGV